MGRPVASTGTAGKGEFPGLRLGWAKAALRSGGVTNAPGPLLCSGATGMAACRDCEEWDGVEWDGGLGLTRGGALSFAA